MRIITVLIIALLFSTNIIAQEILSTIGGKVYIGMSVGPSFPVGSFGNDDPQDERSGYANTGYTIELNGGIRLLNLLEISVCGFRNSNNTNITNLVNSLNSLYPGSNLRANSDSWEIFGVLGGLGTSFSLPANSVADIKVLGGYLNTSSPTFSVESNNSQDYVRIEGMTVASPVYFGSFSVRYPVGDDLYLSIGFQYISSNATFENVKTITSINGEIEESTTSFRQSMDTTNLVVGLKYFVL